jgi:hypothetical protein
MAHDAPVSTSNIVHGKRARKATAAALASTAQATDAEQDADLVAPESREDALQSTEPVQKRAKGSWEPKRSPKNVITANTFALVAASTRVKCM